MKQKNLDTKMACLWPQLSQSLMMERRSKKILVTANSSFSITRGVMQTVVHSTSAQLKSILITAQSKNLDSWGMKLR